MHLSKRVWISCIIAVVAVFILGILIACLRKTPGPSPSAKKSETEDYTEAEDYVPDGEGRRLDDETAETPLDFFDDEDQDADGGIDQKSEEGDGFNNPDFETNGTSGKQETIKPDNKDSGSNNNSGNKDNNQTANNDSGNKGNNQTANNDSGNKGNNQIANNDSGNKGNNQTANNSSGNKGDSSNSNSKPNNSGQVDVPGKADQNDTSGGETSTDKTEQGDKPADEQQKPAKPSKDKNTLPMDPLK